MRPRASELVATLYWRLLASVDRYLVCTSVMLHPSSGLIATGTNVFPASEKPYYRKGMWISAAFCLLVAVLSCVLSLWLIWENKKMEKEGVPEVEEFEDTSIARPTGQHERHRYIW